MTPREAAHRLFGTPLHPDDDDKQQAEPSEKTPNERMNELLYNARHKREEPTT
jgi:hypothetical protein